MLAAPNTDLSVCAQNRDCEYTQVNTAIGKKVENVNKKKVSLLPKPVRKFCAESFMISHSIIKILHKL